MPELPEVETIRAGLAEYVIGRRIQRAEVLRDRSVRRHEGGPEAFCAQVAGLEIQAVARRGKFLWLVLAVDGEPFTALAAHLGMSGQFIYHSVAPEQPHKHLRVRLYLDEGVLDFIDQRTFGYLALSELAPTSDGLPGGVGSDLPLVSAIAAHISRDLLDPALDRTGLVARIRAKNVAIKRLLLDQNVVSGVGNIYADEALWRAQIHYATPGSALNEAELAELLEHAAAVMGSALEQGGTSFDALYVNVNGESGYFAHSLNAYGRGGEPCYCCGTIMKRIPFAGRSSTFCPKCQRKK